MIDESFLRQYALRNQTTFSNILREYFQHLFLANFYRQENSENFLFKGGTALKLVFGSPRFSEDIDFTGISNSKIYEKLLEGVLEDFHREGVDPDLVESKQTSGGHLTILEFRLFGENIKVRNEISFRKHIRRKRKPIVVTSEIVPVYTVYLLSREELVAEKIGALLTRRKPRDFFDLYFILRKEELRKELKLQVKQRKRILRFLEKQDKKKIEQELKTLLPKDFWKIIKDLPTAIRNQLAL